jgi:hypothetical protein
MIHSTESWTEDKMATLKRLSVFFHPGRRGSHQCVHQISDENGYTAHPSPNSSSLFKRSMSLLSRSGSSGGSGSESTGYSPGRKYTNQS